MPQAFKQEIFKGASTEGGRRAKESAAPYGHIE